MNIARSSLRRSLAMFALGAFALAPAIARSDEGERRVWTHTIGSHQDFLKFSAPVGGVPFTKFVIVPETGKTYIFWTAVYPFHFHFVTQVLLGGKGGDPAANPIRSDAWDQTFHMGAIGWKGGYYAYEFLESDTPEPHVLRRVDQALRKAFEHGRDKVRFRPITDKQRAVLAKTPEIAWVAADFLTAAGDFQLLSLGAAVGTLVVPPQGAEVEKMALATTDIVVLDSAPDDIAPVAGIVSTRFTSPLGHVNLRARAWRIPNCGWKKALEVARPLAGKRVFYETRSDGAVLRLATEAEVKQAARRKERRKVKVVIPPSDLAYRELPDLTAIRRTDVVRVGTKASNLGELATDGGGDAYTVPGGFAVPFAFYADHLARHGLDKRIKAMLSDGKFRKDRAHREATLEKLRHAMQEAELDPAFVKRIDGKVTGRFPGQGVFVRSSTNAEDLPGFNGAGLYDTVPNVKGAEALGAAVKQVWASLWNFRAHEERTRAGIDHQGVYPSVLVQVAASAAGAGVIVTKNVFDPEAGPAVFINAKRGLGIRVVGGGRIPEQVLYDETTREIRVISRSDDAVALVMDAQGGVKEIPASKEPFLTKARIRTLVRAAKRVRSVFKDGGPQDIEWIIGDDDEIRVVQTRPFVDGS